MNFRGRFTVSGKTAAANTAFAVLIPPKPKAFAVITKIKYINGGTTQGHTLTVLQPVGVSTLAATATAAQKTVQVTADPAGTYYGPAGPGGTTSRVAPVATSSGDYIVIGPLPDGTYLMDTAASTVVTGSTTGSTFALTNNVPTGGIAAGAQIWNLKVTGQTDPWTANVFNTFAMPFGMASGQTTPTSNAVIGGVTELNEPVNGVDSSHEMGWPLVLYSNNISVAGVLDTVDVIYTKYGG